LNQPNLTFLPISFKPICCRIFNKNYLEDEQINFLKIFAGEKKKEGRKGGGYAKT
jgi:hypothetical protein